MWEMYLFGDSQRDVAVSKQAAARIVSIVSNQTRLKLIKHYVHIGLRFEESLNVLYASWKWGNGQSERC